MSMDRKIEKKKWPPKKIAMIAGGGLFFSFILYSFIWGDSSSKLNVKTERITISTVASGPFQEFIPVTGTVQPIKTIFLDAIEGGKVDTVYREAGNFVKAGDKILRLANTTLLISISNQDAMVVEQRNLLTNTQFQLERNRIQNRQRILELQYNILRLKRQYDRNKKLHEQSLISQSDFDATKDEYDYQVRLNNLTIEAVRSDSVFQEIQVGQLEKSLLRLQENLQIARRRLDELVIKAPISGQLTSLNAEIGESKSQGQRLGQIDVLDGFKVVAAIDEHYLPRVEIGQNGEFDFAGQTYALITTKIYPEIRDGRFDVDMVFDGQEPDGIRRGQTVHIRLQFSGLTDQVLLPLGGFYQKTGGQWVYVLDESEESAVKRKIRLGRKNTQVFEVLEGLGVGEKVITSSYDNFGDIDKLILK
ncbi:MAG: efflux RND transporter periplasmic adaptor subunit [bacterium]